METIKKMFTHLQWANERILEQLNKSEGFNQQVIRLFSHILFAEQVWFTRIQGADSSHLPIWSDAELSDCEKLVKQNEKSAASILSQLSSSRLDETIVYQNSQGKTFNQSIREILIHVALHGQYHRGQINTWLRGNDLEPASVDFILYARSPR